MSPPDGIVKRSLRGAKETRHDAVRRRGLASVDPWGARVHDDEGGWAYVPTGRETEGDRAKRRRFDLAGLTPVATVAVCELDAPPAEDSAPGVSMTITQCVRLSDDSLIRLDMDRGVTSWLHGAPPGAPISWKRPLDEVIAEVLVLVGSDDEEDPDGHPWEELAAAARTRGVEVDAETLSRLPYQVLLSAEAVAVFVR